MGNKAHVLMAVSKGHAQYIEELKKKLIEATGTDKITTRFATEILQEILPKDVQVEKIIFNDRKHLRKDRTIEIVLKYNIGEI